MIDIVSYINIQVIRCNDFHQVFNVFRVFFHRCKCGNCGIQLLTNGNECYCCCELEGCEEAMNSEEVLQDLKAEGVQNAKCVTQHPGFNPVCLQKWSLKLAADKYKTKNNDKYSQMATQERLDNF